MKPKNLMLIMSLPLLGYACNNLGGRPMPKDDTGVHVLDTGEADTDTDTDADTDTDTDTDTDPHYSSLQAPAYVVSSLVFAEFLESESFNLIVSQIFDGSFPPESDDIVLIWDPIGEVEGQDWFQAEFGVGDVVEPVDAGEFDFPETSNTLTLDYAVTGDDSFASTNTGITMQLGEVGGFGFSFALYNAGIEGQFQFDHLYIDGSITGCLLPTELEGLEVMGYEVYDFIDDRTINCYTGLSADMDGWTFRMDFTGYDFLD